MRRAPPTPVPEPVVRFETPAGHQAQVDFAQFRFPWGIRPALLVVLGYARLLWCRFYPRQDMATLYDGLEDAFRLFGGVPREVLFDQMKTVTTRDLRLEGGAMIRNVEFLPPRTTGRTAAAPPWDGHPLAPRPAVRQRSRAASGRLMAPTQVNQRQLYRTRDPANAAIAVHIETVYSRSRRHNHLGGASSPW